MCALASHHRVRPKVLSELWAECGQTPNLRVAPSPENGQKEVPLPVEAWKRDSGSDGRRSRDLSIFSRLKHLEGKRNARLTPVPWRPTAVNVIQENSFE